MAGGASGHALGSHAVNATFRDLDMPGGREQAEIGAPQGRRVTVAVILTCVGGLAPGLERGRFAIDLANGVQRLAEARPK